jgi:hypothetical protein
MTALILSFLLLQAVPPALPPKPTNVKVGSTTEPAKTIEFVPGVGTTYSLSCAGGTCSLTINYTGGPPDVVDFKSASRTAPVKAGTTPPATCTLGDWFFDTDAAPGANILLCTATNTWTQVTGSGGGSGNSYISMPAANCQYGTASTAFSLGSSDTPTAACVEGTNVRLGVLQFDESGVQAVQTQIRLEGTVNGVNLAGTWRTSATSGNVVWQVQTACAGDGATADPAWGTAQTIVDAAKSTANQLNNFSLTGVNACSSGQTMFVRFFRDPAHASDNLNATAELVGLTWTIVR